MTVIIDPAGSHDVVYRDESRNIQEVSAAGVGGNGNSASATLLASATAHNVILLSTTTDNIGIKLPSDAEIGDLFEIHQVSTPGGNPFLYNPDGSTFASSFTNVYVRKLDATTWRYWG